MKVYLDSAATTKLDPRVLEEMMPYLTDVYGNASSLHSFGRQALNAVDKARLCIAQILGASPGEIYFTSGGTESDNWAVKGAARALKKSGKHIITTEIEHPAMIQTCKELEKEGFEVTYLGVDNHGIISLEELKKAVRDDTILITVMYANNEIGSIQPIPQIGKFAQEEGILFHTDAVQAVSSLDINVKNLNVDMLSISAHKFHGPKGIGILYIKNGVRISKLIVGGHQEKGFRAGTTNTPAIVGMAKALELCEEEKAENNKRIKELRDYLIKRIEDEIPFSHLNGHREKRLVSNANFSFDYVEGEAILMQLDLKGIAVSSGSACSSGSLDPSHVMLAIGCPIERSHSSIRFSLDKDTTREEIDYTVDSLKEIIEKLRSWSPLFNVEKGEGTYV
ncbi:MAG: cysteine desulfurase NifS [Bacillota bacterium]|jgi:cysteine desulfurase|nr:cysteine desulfurase NifS [Bacillota bacterium]HHU42746.1 cysteine desulfurase NifS [Clostridiales bacterium]